MLLTSKIFSTRSIKEIVMYYCLNLTHNNLIVSYKIELCRFNYDQSPSGSIFHVNDSLYF